MKIPLPWMHCHARLVCIKCGQVIWWGGGEWKDFELKENAHIESYISKHRCGLQEQTSRIYKAWYEMRVYRATHPPMTFEEECKVYNDIMANQTYL
jgi:hypothetical protein